MRDLKIYTSYFAKYKSLIDKGLYPVSVARFSPTFITDVGCGIWSNVAPTDSILKQIKLSKHLDSDIEIYTKRYLNEVLGAYDKTPLYLIQQLYDLVPDNYNACVLLCYEKSSDFCHRHLLADWLNQHIPGLNITEFDFSEDENKESLSNALF